MIGPFAFSPKATVSARMYPMAQALVQRGHQVTLWLPPHDNLSDAGKVIERDGVRIHNLSLKRVSAWTPLCAAWRLASLVRSEHPDIVHVFKPVGYAALAGMFLHCTSRMPLVTDTDDWEGTGGWNSVNPYPWHWKRFFDFQERWLPRHSAIVTVASRTLQTQVWGMGVPPANVIYVPNCPEQTFAAQLTSLRESQSLSVRERLGVGNVPLAMYVGHITLGDDLDLALLALRAVQERVPEATLVFVGTGEGLQPLQRQAEQLGLSHRVIFTDWIDHEQIPAYLAAADAAIYPYRDSLINRAKCSIKILEYMAMGKAIVTHRVGQNVEYLENGVSGLLVEPGNVTDFAEALVAVLTDRAFAARLGKQAAIRIREKFDWAQRVLDVEHAYRIACEASQNSEHRA